MWERLLNLFKNEPDEEIQKPIEPVIEQPLEQSSVNITPIKTHSKGSFNGPGRMIGFNYLKRRGEEDENANPPRKFINLSKLLRGKFGNG